MTSCHIEEFNQGGELLCSYSSTKNDKSSQPRLIIKKPLQTKSRWEQVLDIFLPAGYPTSVTDEYLKYRIYDTFQAFPSSIAGMLASRAVLEGVGVGDATAHPTTVLLFSIFQESFGRLAFILLAHRLGSALEPECKMYRLAADIFNDAAFIMDCLSPMFPKSTRVFIFTIGHLFRAIVGVAAGSSKASLSAHFAKGSNLGDVNAKSSSQETAMTLISTLVGSVIVSRVSDPITVWSLLMALVAIHIYLNYAAVRSVSLLTLNRQRANIALSNLLQHDKALTPKAVSKQERIFDGDGQIRTVVGNHIGYARIGVSFKALYEKSWLSRSEQPNSWWRVVEPNRLLDIFAKESYLLWPEKHGPTIRIVLKQDITPHLQLKAWLQAIILCQDLEKHVDYQKKEKTTLEHVVKNSLVRTNKIFQEYCNRLKTAGWDLQNTTLETSSGPRIAVQSIS